MEDCYIYVLADCLTNERMPTTTQEIGRGFQPSHSYAGWPGSSMSRYLYAMVCAHLCNRTHVRQPTVPAEIQQSPVDLLAT